MFTRTEHPRGSARNVSGLLALCAIAALTTPGLHAQESMVYTLSNDIEEGRNAVIAYRPAADGSLLPHPAGPFLTRGTGIDNDTNGKLGPNDNDTPLAVSEDGRFLFAVNGHSNTIAAFDILDDGSLRHVEGSPFSSMGIGPVSLAISGDILLVANRNEDPHQLGELRGAAYANYASFRIGDDGCLTFVSKVELEDGQKNTQVLVSSHHGDLVFGNDFQVDVDFDGEGSVSRLFSAEPAVRGGLRSFKLDHKGKLHMVDVQTLPETVEPAPEVPTVPLGIWDHPIENLLYVGLVTRNQLGVYRYDQQGKLSFVTAVPNSGQDICWLKTSADGTRLYAVNNLPREDEMDTASTVTVFDISGDRAWKPVEIGRVELPLPYGTFINNRNAAQPNSAAFQFDLDEQNGFLYVVMQRINQTAENQSDDGNVIHTVRPDPSADLEVVASRLMKKDGVPPRARPQGMLVVTLD
jgi:6-phosphogluconolactonase (cycloisomerase 2 family)